MRIHSWGHSAGVCGAQPTSTQSSQHQCDTDNTPVSHGSSQVDVSKPAELFQKLSALKSADPVAFKAATNQIAEHFNQLASMAQGPERVGLSQLAGKFANAAQTGDLSALQPASAEPAACAPPAAAAPAEPAAPPGPSPAESALASAVSMVDSLTTSPTGETTGDPMQRLAALKSSAPAAFKQVMNRVAEQLGQLGNMAQGADADSLSQLASSFANSAETGDISAYMPAQPPAAPVAPAPAPAPAAPPPVNPRDTALELVDAMTAPTATGLVSDPLQKLKDLKSADLPSFQHVMNQVAERLDQLSNFAEGEAREGLSKLAGIFASGSETGDLSALEPAVAAPPPAPPPAAAPSEHWRSGHALASYHRHGAPAAPQAIDDAFASALQLVDSLGS